MMEIRKKGSSAVDVLGVVFLFIMMFIVLLLIPSIINEILKMSIQWSPEVVSGDLAGLITISASAPQDIIIHYEDIPPKISYDVTINIQEGMTSYRTVGVQILDMKKKPIPNGFSSDKIAVNMENTLYEFSGANSFTIVKRGGKNPDITE